MKKCKLNIEEKINEYIEMINSDYLPQTYDGVKKFSDETIIGYFWKHYKNRIKNELEKEKYAVDYDLAKFIANEKNYKLAIKIDEYIQLLNTGYIPKDYEREIKFKDGTIIGYFYKHQKQTIVDILNNNSKYKIGYELAKKIIGEKISNCSKKTKIYKEQCKNKYQKTVNTVNIEQRIDEYIQLLNTGYIPKDCEGEIRFKDGTIIGYFFKNYKQSIIDKLNNNQKYKIGYDLALNTINVKVSKIDIWLKEYIELLNTSYKPRNYETKVTFKDGTLIKYFWKSYKNKVRDELIKKDYDNGYELAREVAFKLTKEETFMFDTVLKKSNIEKEQLSKYGYTTIFMIYKLSKIFKNKSFMELLCMANDYIVFNKITWIYNRYGNNIIDILTFLNLDSKSIINNMKENIVTLKTAILKEVFRENISLNVTWLYEIYYSLIKNVNFYDNEEKLINTFITITSKYELTKEEKDSLKTAFMDYIKVIKEYYIVKVALIEDFDLKCRRIKKYHLTTEEIMDSYYITMYFIEQKLIDNNESIYERRQLMRQYLIDYDEYSLEEKEELINSKILTTDELSHIDKINTEIKNMVKCIRFEA